MKRLPVPGKGGPESEQGAGSAGHVFAPCQKHARTPFFGWNAHNKSQEFHEGGNEIVAQQVWSGNH